MESSRLVLEKCEINRKYPDFLFEFKNDNATQSFEMNRQAIIALMRALPLATAKYSEAILDSENNQDNKNYWLHTVYEHNSNSIKFEGSYYSGNAYLFLCPYFLSDPSKRKTQDVTGGYNVDDSKENRIIMDEELEKFERLLKNGTATEEIPRWIPRKGRVQLKLNDIPKLQKFINQQFVV